MNKLNLTEREVSQAYCLGIKHLRLMRMRGTGPVFKKVSGTIGKTGGRVIYAVSDVEAWLAARPSGGERLAVWPPAKETR